MNYKEQILSKINSNSEVIGIIGLGYVGLPLAVNFAGEGIKVIGFDSSEEKVSKINAGDNKIKDLNENDLHNAIEKKIFEVTSDFTRIETCDAIIVCVPTPLDKFRKPDMSHIESACVNIGKYMKPGTFISLESTTYPTTTEDFMLPLIEATAKENQYFRQKFVPITKGDESRSNGTEGVLHNTHFWLTYSPERVDPGNKTFTIKNTPKILGAMSDDGLEIGVALYRKVVDEIHTVSSPRVAEMVKILENTYRLVNISLINELALLAGKMDIDIWEVIEAAKTKPFGFQAFYPGPGIGGHCIPLDPFYLEHVARQYDFDLSMIHTAGHINMRMPHYMSVKISSALNRQKKPINGSKVLFLGVAYKADINDDRESPALEIMETIASKGGIVTYHDPHIPTVKTNNGKEYKSVDLTKETLQSADAVVLTTNHSVFNADFIRQHAQLIVDLRNMVTGTDEKVYKL